MERQVRAMDRTPNDHPDNDTTGKVRVRVAGRADWYDDDFQTRSATPFPRYEVATVDGPPRRGSIASFNQDDDAALGEAMATGVTIEVDVFRVLWLPDPR